MKNFKRIFELGIDKSSSIDIYIMKGKNKRDCDLTLRMAFLALFKKIQKIYWCFGVSRHYINERARIARLHWF